MLRKKERNIHRSWKEHNILIGRRMEQLQTALTAIKVLRSNVGQVFESLGNGLRAEHGEENKESKYLFELQELLTTVNLNLR